MSASATPPASVSRFQSGELDMLAKTADALSAYLGKPVLAEVDATEEGLEWVTFGIPMEENASRDGEDPVRVQMGGPGSRLLGNRGGLDHTDEDVYDCLYLWAIQITLTEGERFVKLDQDGEEAAWSDTLADVLPFDLTDEDLSALDDEDDEDEDEDEDDGDGAPGGAGGGHDGVHRH
ncbi:hypothetical protein [Achromobacter aloeverae]|uniref:Ortholog of Bordetella pertussis (BX470248) BP3235 n=1 Tax=Achromobacter aloeverae TaxID=1750518 RepID=A0A4Q1HCH9_9BURK|nr:hypothetical protein [Achromobacter aloeverae]RXN83263.1 hypothetical protein C7R54_27640 [Achromobacter aloeverae]